MPSYQEWGIATGEEDASALKQAKAEQQAYQDQKTPAFELAIRKKGNALLAMDSLEKLGQQLRELAYEIEKGIPHPTKWLAFLEEKFPYYPAAIRPLGMDDAAWEKAQQESQKFHPQFWEPAPEGKGLVPKRHPFRYSP